MTSGRALAASLLVVLCAVGCTIPQQKHVEQENASLRESLQQNKELLDQSQSAQKKQKAVISACQEKITAMEKHLAELEMLKVQLRKQKEFLETELTRTKADVKKQAALAENYRIQVDTLNKQLTEARTVIGQLQKKVEEASKKPTTRPASGPVGK